MNKKSTIDKTIRQILADEALPYKSYIQQIIEKNSKPFKSHQHKNLSLKSRHVHVMLNVTYNEIKDKFKELKSIRKTALYFNISESYIFFILRNHRKNDIDKIAIKKNNEIIAILHFRQ